MTMLDGFTIEGGGSAVDMRCERCHEIPGEFPWLSIPWGESLQKIVELADRHLEEEHPVDYQKILESVIVAAVITKETSEA